MPKLSRLKQLKDAEDPIVEWLQFLDAKSEEVMEMLAEKNQGIQRAYDVLKRVSDDEKARMAYEAREAEIRDQLTREKVAREEGIQKGIEKGIQKGIEKIAVKMILKGKSNEEIEDVTELTAEEVEKLRKQYSVM